MRTFFTADVHLGHKNIIPLACRPFTDLEDMHSQLISRWNETVGSGDMVYILGDLICRPGNKNKEKRHALTRTMLELCSQLNGTKFLIRGNHDPVHPMDNAERSLFWDDEFFRLASIHVLDPIHYFTESVILSHFPWVGTFDDRYLPYQPVREDYPEVDLLLHGHVHGVSSERDHGWKFKEDMINVGVDVWDYRPVDFETLLSEYYAWKDNNGSNIGSHK